MNDYTGAHPRTLAGGGDYISHHGDRPVGFEMVAASQILDSRGYPTVQVTLTSTNGDIVEASAPAGASTGEHEAVEVRDGGHAFSGRGVRRAVANVDEEIAPLLTSHGWTSLRDVDAALRELDGTDSLSRIGANAVIAVSMAATRAFAHATNVPLHRYLSHLSGAEERLPVPHFNVINGGAHAPGGLPFQEFMIAPVGAANEEHALQTGAEIYHALAEAVRSRFGMAGLGDEGGFAPPIDDPEQALDLLMEAITTAGYTPGVDQVAIAMDPAANGFAMDGGYRIGSRTMNREQLADYYTGLVYSYPIRSIEDGFAEDDHAGWSLLFERLADKIQLVGDDLYVTDPARIRDGAEHHYSNAALIKPNQIGTVTDTLAAISTAREADMACMVSHRSGETLDTFIADLAVGTGVGQIKSGAPARGERLAKYNRLVQIEATNAHLPFGLQ